MTKPLDFAILVSLIAFIMVIGSFILEPDGLDFQLTFVASGVERSFLVAGTLCSIPFVFAMPRLQARFMWGKMRRVPAQTHLMPRWAIQLCIVLLTGQAIGFLLLALLRDQRLVWRALSAAIIVAALRAGASSRLKKHRRTEFTMLLWRRRRLF